MGSYRNLDTKHCNRTTKCKRIKCIQINLQHSRLETDNIRKIIEDSTDILCIREPYTIQNKTVGLSKNHKTFTSGEGRNSAAIVVTNQIDTLLLNQLSDEDMVVLEVIIGNVKIILAGMLKIEAILLYAKGAGVLIAADSNSRSVSWHNTLTNRRGRIPKEFLMSKQIHILNKESDYTNFWSHRGTRNIDITVISNQLLNTVVEWEISEQESCSNHNIIRYAIGQSADHRTATDDQELRYAVKRIIKSICSET